MSPFWNQPTASPPPWQLRPGVSLALAIILGLGLGWQARPREIWLVGDAPIYLTLSQSLSSGHYRDEYLVGTPPHAQYPPGFPAWLLGIRAVFGPEFDTARAANFLLLALTALLVADLVRRLCGAWTGAAAGALSVINPLTLRYTGAIYSEALFTTLVAIAIWSAHRADEDRHRRWSVVALAAGLAGFLTRVAGLAPLMGLLAWTLVRRRWGQTVAFAAATVATVGAWGAYTMHAAAGSIGRSYGAEIARLDLGMVDHLRRVLLAVKQYLTGILPIALQIPTIEGTPLDNAIVVLGLCTLGILGMVFIGRRSPGMILALLAYTGMLVLWLWPNTRFLLPILPWVTAVLVVGAHQLGTRLQGRLRRAPVLLLVALLAMPALRSDVARAAEYRNCEAARIVEPTSCFPRADRGYVEATRYIRDHLPEGAIIVGSKPATIYLLSGRQSLPAYLARGKDGMPTLDPLLERGGTYFLIGPRRPRSADDGESVPYFVALCDQLTTVAAYPGALLLAHRTDPASQPDACSDAAAQVSGPPLPGPAEPSGADDP